MILSGVGLYAINCELDPDTNLVRIGALFMNETAADYVIKCVDIDTHKWYNIDTTEVPHTPCFQIKLPYETVQDSSS